MKGGKSNGGSSTERIADARFASFETDPRFRLPSKKHTKTKLDKRFSGMLNDKDFTDSAKVDRYGRKIKSDTKKKALERLYEAEDSDEKEEDEVEEIEVEDDDVVQKELLAAQKSYDPARGGGFSSSEEDSDSDEESVEEEELEIATEGDMQRLQNEQAEVEAGEVTNRIAIVNLDWDHVNSTDLFALFSSFLGDDGGSIKNIAVYPSEFGKERMQQEEAEGPPKELFKKSKASDSESNNDSSDEDSDSESDEKIKNELIKEGDDQDFDSDALRKYQLDRLRYYYAVMECSSPQTAQKIYEATDGTEYQSSSNFIDLRFVPDDVTFDDEPRDECNRLSETYKPVEFVTSALQSSKVKLTWDLHPEEATRKESIKRAFTGSRADINENDLRAYLASDSDGSDNESEQEEEDEENDNAEEDAAEDGPKLSKKELARRKMREALGLGAEPAARSSTDSPVGEMEITFTPALAADKSKSDDTEETTIEKYKRKERERKEKRREAARAKRGVTNDKESDNEEVAAAAVDDELGFDDPFFTTEAPTISKSAQRKADRLKKREAREAAEAEAASQKAHLTKVMAEDEDENLVGKLDHFDMNEIVRAEKIRGKKGKAAKSKKNKEKLEKATGLLQDDFEMDVDDDRFKAVFDNHEFAIDPSNPKFKATGGMKKLLEEGRKKRRGEDRGESKPKRAKR